MNREQQERLFKPFSQGDSSVSRNLAGPAGAGDQQRLANLLGGRISCDSQPGNGSVFTLVIAIGNETHVELHDPTQREQVDVGSTASPYSLNCHVLVVDDRRDLRFSANVY